MFQLSKLKLLSKLLKSGFIAIQAEEGITKAFFEASREAVEATGHIFDSTVITSYLAG